MIKKGKPVISAIDGIGKFNLPVKNRVGVSVPNIK
jgi:hypothetical protein